ncbi:hypothetical protein [Bacillus sp. IBL03825]|uniref:hypothetical protein n=1 Tax=Bacillus sp. IBL03825 TaxID=2953580 RepID=UPI002157D2B9|nr:hypothetical protein [Bacillus sp. IBL03825]MCR6845170.1 hypothetical protein [Bacillus sp. IBL03825]
MNMYVVTLRHYTDEAYFDIECVCPTKEIAKEQVAKLQREKDPDYNEWKYSWDIVKVISE